VQAINRSDRVDYAVWFYSDDVHISSHLHGQLITATINHIISKAESKGGILVFLPGVQEIRQCIDSLQGSPAASQAKIFPLHANLSSDEQRAVFPPASKWKIVVATNVAEVRLRAIIRHPLFYIRPHYRPHRLLSLLTTSSMSLTLEKLKRRNTTLRAASPNSSNNGSPALPDDSAGGVQDARAPVCAISYIRAIVRVRWSDSRVPRSCVSR
jgi:hypothetical protein